MPAMEVDNNHPLQILDRPRRTRLETQRIFHGANPNEKSLELDGVVKVLNSYSDYEGGINCSICGKLYKSKVCLTKHLWEHTVYWDQFDDEKNHDRVLSIQAALIMYAQSRRAESASLHSLLVTSPHQNDKKRDAADVTSVPAASDVTTLKTPEKKRPLRRKLLSEYRKSSPRNRKRSCSSVSSKLSLPGTKTPSFSLLDSEMSPSKSARQM